MPIVSFLHKNIFKIIALMHVSFLKFDSNMVLKV